MARHPKFASSTLIMALIAVGWSAPALAQTLCPGQAVDPLPWAGFILGQGEIAIQGDRVAFLAGATAPQPLELGGASVHRFAPGSSTLVHEDDLIAMGLGFGFAAYPLGGASPAVERCSSPQGTASAPVTLHQVRRVGPSGAVTTTVTNGSNPVAVVEGARRFDSDGDRAVLSTMTGQLFGGFVVLEFFAVDGAGDWFIEDRVRGPWVGSEWGILGVVLRGDRALLLTTAQDGPVAFERQAGGQWTPFALPASLASVDTFGATLEGETLVTTHREPFGGRVDVHDRQPSGQWTLSTSIPYVSPSGAGEAPTNPHVSGDILTFETFRVAPSVQRETRIYRRATLTSAEFVAALAAPVLRLSAEHAFLGVGALTSTEFVKILELDALVPGVRLCVASGDVVCERQRAGDLTYARDLPLEPQQPGELVLTGALPSRMALIMGGTDAAPPAAAVDALCIAPSGCAVASAARLGGSQRQGSMERVPRCVPLLGGGVGNLTGQTFHFQALVRTPVGAASTRGVAVQL